MISKEFYHPQSPTLSLSFFLALWRYNIEVSFGGSGCLETTKNTLNEFLS